MAFFEKLWESKSYSYPQKLLRAGSSEISMEQDDTVYSVSDDDPGTLSQSTSMVIEKKIDSAVKMKMGTEDGEDITYEYDGELYPVEIKSQSHKLIYKLCISKVFNGFILITIFINTIMLVVSVSPLGQARLGWSLMALDNVFFAIYLMEMILKFYGLRLTYFDDGWNILDFLIVVFNIIDFAVPLILQNVSGLATGAAIFRTLRVFRAVRAVRALRVVRTIRFLASLQAIVTTIIYSMKSIGAIVAIISVFIYTFAVIGRSMYAEANPLHFGNLFTTIFTLFQLLTLDDWFEIYTTVVENDPSKWHVILFLFFYLIVEYFVFLNLFVAVLVDNFQITLQVQEAENETYEAQKNLREDNKDHKDRFLFEDEIKKRTMAEHYPKLSPDKLKELEHFFALLASLEYNIYSYQEQRRMLELVLHLINEKDEISTGGI